MGFDSYTPQSTPKLKTNASDIKKNTKNELGKMRTLIAQKNPESKKQQAEKAFKTINSSYRTFNNKDFRDTMNQLNKYETNSHILSHLNNHQKAEFLHQRSYCILNAIVLKYELKLTRSDTLEGNLVGNIATSPKVRAAIIVWANKGISSCTKSINLRTSSNTDKAKAQKTNNNLSSLRKIKQWVTEWENTSSKKIIKKEFPIMTARLKTLKHDPTNTNVKALIKKNYKLNSRTNIDSNIYIKTPNNGTFGFRISILNGKITSLKRLKLDFPIHGVNVKLFTNKPSTGLLKRMISKKYRIPPHLYSDTSVTYKLPNGQTFKYRLQINKGKIVRLGNKEK